MAQPEVIIGDASDFQKEHEDAYPLFCRMMTFAKPGVQEPAHTHRDGHFNAAVRGRFLMNVEGRQRIVKAPELVWISAGTEHEITALPMDEEDEAKLRAAFAKGFDAVRALFEESVSVCLHDRRAWEPALRRSRKRKP